MSENLDRYTSYKNNVLLSESWVDSETGLAHRLDGPAEIFYDPSTGIAERVLYYVNEQRHRVDGPAYIETDPKTGVLCEEMYFQEDLLHRVDGPAWITRDRKTGEVLQEAYYVNGKPRKSGKSRESDPDKEQKRKERQLKKLAAELGLKVVGLEDS